MPGYSYLNILTLLYASVFNLTLLTMVNFVQPYLLEEVLRIPRGEQGALTGFLAALQEVVVISLMGLVGALSDRTGRRILFSIGFVILALGYFLYPLASSPEQLIAFRVVVAVGAAILPVMLGASLIDFIQECSRGKWLGTTSIFNGIGVILMSIVFGQLPGMDVKLHVPAEIPDSGGQLLHTLDPASAPRSRIDTGPPDAEPVQLVEPLLGGVRIHHAHAYIARPQDADRLDHPRVVRAVGARLHHDAPRETQGVGHLPVVALQHLRGRVASRLRIGIIRLGPENMKMTIRRPLGNLEFRRFRIRVGPGDGGPGYQARPRICWWKRAWVYFLFFFRYGLWHCVQLSDKALNVLRTAFLSFARAALARSLAIFAESLAIFV